MSKFKILYPIIQGGPDKNKDLYWFYHIIKDIEVIGNNLEFEEDSINYEIYGERYENRPELYYKLVEVIEDFPKEYLPFIRFETYQIFKNSKAIMIDYFQRRTLTGDYNTYNVLLNKIIEIISLINEKNKTDKIKIYINRHVIENYVEDKKKWKTVSRLGQMKPTIFTRMGIDNHLEWVPNKKISISDFEPDNKSKAIEQKLIDTPAGKKHLDRDAANLIMRYVGNTEKDHFQGGKKTIRKSKNKNKKSRKRNFSKSKK
jgi:hypothetical protein